MRTISIDVCCFDEKKQIVPECLEVVESLNLLLLEIRHVFYTSGIQFSVQNKEYSPSLIEIEGQPVEFECHCNTELCHCSVYDKLRKALFVITGQVPSGQCGCGGQCGCH